MLPGEAVEGTVGLTHSPDVAAESEGLELTGDDLAVGIDLGNVDLHAGVILGSDQAVGGRAGEGNEWD